MTSTDLTIKGDIQRLHLEPGDRLVVTIDDEYLPPEVAKDIHERLQEHFPDHEVIMLTSCLSLTVQSAS